MDKITCYCCGQYNFRDWKIKTDMYWVNVCEDCVSTHFVESNYKEIKLDNYILYDVMTAYECNEDKAIEIIEGKRVNYALVERKKDARKIRAKLLFIKATVGQLTIGDRKNLADAIADCKEVLEYLEGFK